MNILIHTPEAEAFGSTISIVYSIACLTVSAHLHARWFGRLGFDFTSVHCAIMAILVAWLALTTDFGAAFSLENVPLSLGLGLAIGAVATASDRSIIRFYARRRSSGERRERWAPKRDAHSPVRIVPLGFAAGPQRTIGPKQVQERLNPYPRGLRLMLLPVLGAAVLEEIVFRGFLTRSSLQFGSWLPMTTGVLGSALAFALSHVFFGWTHVAAKLPLSAFTTLGLLCTQSVWASVVGHCAFNLWVWWDYRRTTVDPTARPVSWRWTS